jgi:hypothetical protein
MSNRIHGSLFAVACSHLACGGRLAHLSRLTVTRITGFLSALGERIRYVTIPLGFVGAILGTLLSHDLTSEARFSGGQENTSR